MRFDTADLAAFQHDFIGQVTAAEVADCPPGLAVHRATHLHGLIDVLLGVFVKTAEMLGESPFKAFARDYVRARPLTRGDRNLYGDDFGDFLARHPHAGDLVWLPDLARFEYAVHRAHHAHDAAACDFEALLAPDGMVGLHPSAYILASPFDIAELYGAVAEPMIVRTTPGLWLVGRTPADDVIWLPLTPVEGQFLTTLCETHSLFATLDQMAPDDIAMTCLQTLLARLVANGLLISLTLDALETPQ